MAIYKSTTYKLRASNPMPTSEPGEFVLHSFKAEIHSGEYDTCATSLPSSSEFVGQGGGLISASYNRVALADGLYFQGRKATGKRYTEEETYFAGD